MQQNPQAHRKDLNNNTEPNSVQQLSNLKYNLKEAKRLKDEGNSLFTTQKYKEAIDSYSRAILYCLAESKEMIPSDFHEIDQINHESKKGWKRLISVFGKRISSVPVSKRPPSSSAACPNPSPSESQRNSVTKKREISDEVKELKDIKALLYSNRCASCLLLYHKKNGGGMDVDDDVVTCGDYGLAEKALSDANHAIELRPDWFKGHLRRAQSLCCLKRYPEAKQAYINTRESLVESASDYVAYLRWLKDRIIYMDLLINPEQDNVIFKTIQPGRDICLYSLNPINRLVYDYAKRMHNQIYIVGDKASRECVLVDPCWDTDALEKIVKKMELKLVACIITHNHFDHVGGKPPAPFDSFGVLVQGLPKLLSKHKNLKVYVGPIDAENIATENNLPLDKIITTKDQEEITLGDKAIKLKFFHTPGHTPGSQCILVQEKRLLTGDTLFYRSCGRTDLEGGSEMQLYDSLQNRFNCFKGDTVIFPGHCYGASWSTIESERDVGLLKKISPEQWMQSLISEERSHTHKHASSGSNRAFSSANNNNNAPGQSPTGNL